MNIFVLHRDPRIAAQMACNSHICKMSVESTQLLATVARQHGLSVTYRPTHINNPCTLWVARSKDNYEWLLAHGIALAEEYTLRYKRIHLSAQYLEGELSKCPDSIPRIGLTPFVQCMPEEYKHEDAIIAYRTFYLKDKVRFAKWSVRDEPPWFTYEQPDLEY